MKQKSNILSIQQKDKYFAEKSTLQMGFGGSNRFVAEDFLREFGGEEGGGKMGADIGVIR